MRSTKGRAVLVFLRSGAGIMSYGLTSLDMPNKPLIQTRIDPVIKEEAAAVLAAIGLTVSDAVRLMLTRVAREKALPFEPLIPNTVTITAMKEGERGKLPRFASVQALMEDLHAND